MASFPKPPTVNDDRRALDIYRKAAAILRVQGFDATSMGDIADAVDLTKGGLYYYIKGKTALLYAILSFAMEEVERRVLEPVGAALGARERIARWVGGQTRLMLDEPDAMSVLMQEIHSLAPEHRERIEARYTAYLEALRSAVADLLAGRDGLDIDIATGSLRTMVEGVLRWEPTESGLEADLVVEQTIDMALAALASG